MNNDDTMPITLGQKMLHQRLNMNRAQRRKLASIRRAALRRPSQEPTRVEAVA